MAQNKYLSSENSSLFSIENDIDDEFLRRRQSSNTTNFPYSRSDNVPSYGNSLSSDRITFEERKLQLLEQQRKIEERTVDSTKRSLVLLRNSEEVGIATAQELLKQREQLERTDKRLDDINQTLRFSHKHIQGIKSVFGSLKNYLSGKVDSTPLPLPVDGDQQSSQVNAHVRPTTAASSSAPGSYQLEQPSVSELSDVDKNFRTSIATTANPQKAIDNNMDDIMSSITRLKGLAHGLGEEIESQSDLLDNMLPKVEKSDITIQRQNKDIKRLLK